jgi:hypothetical protein
LSVASAVGKAAGTPLAFYQKLGDNLTSAPGIAAMITGAVFFNIFEFTSLADKFKMTISWRSALLIGFLCGMLNDRVLQALKAFFGT